MRADPPPEPGPFTTLMAGFGYELRGAGVSVGTGDVLTYVAAASVLDPSDLVDLYWAGRATLISRREDLGTYDRVFREYFLGEDSPARSWIELNLTAVPETEAPFVVPSVDPGDAGSDDTDEQSLGLVASGLDTLKHRSFAACTPEELAALRRIMARIRLTPPRRRTRRRRPGATSGRVIDVRAMARETMRAHGEPPELYFRRRKYKLRPLILILDVSGSMAGYSRHLLQFAHTARHAAARVEVFCFGTRLTRVTRDLNPRRPDAALERAAESVVDWDGGTRIGESLDTFIRRYGRGGLARGAVVVICSDGLDRGSPEVLSSAMERLHRLCYRIVWMNPHAGHVKDFQPSTLGMMVAAPHADLLLSGHDLASLEELADLLPVLD
ncbi:MAG: VWA domain-containing protein [Streptosporangiales bacterium]|nr:VWA domain-containing protein [Streptosporangiales bacterium]